MILDIRAQRVKMIHVKESSLNVAFGARVREQRRRGGMSQDQLADAAALSRTSVVNIENGRQGVSIATLYRLADALACPPGELLPPADEVEVPDIVIRDETDSARQAVMTVLRRARRQT